MAIRVTLIGVYAKQYDHITIWQYLVLFDWSTMDASLSNANSITIFIQYYAKKTRYPN